MNRARPWAFRLVQPHGRHVLRDMLLPQSQTGGNPAQTCVVFPLRTRQERTGRPSPRSPGENEPSWCEPVRRARLRHGGQRHRLRARHPGRTDRDGSVRIPGEPERTWWSHQSSTIFTAHHNASSPSHVRTSSPPRSPIGVRADLLDNPFTLRVGIPYSLASKRQHPQRHQSASRPASPPGR